MGVLCLIPWGIIMSQTEPDSYNWSSTATNATNRIIAGTNPLIQSILPLENSNAEHYELIEREGEVFFQVNSPKGENNANEVVLELNGKSSNVFFSIENIYSFCASKECDNNQIIEVFGTNDLGEAIYPNYYFSNEHSENQSVDKNEIFIYKPEINDILVHFDKPIKEIHLLNKKSQATNTFQAYFEIGKFKKLPTNFQVLNTQNALQDFCQVKQIGFLVDASSSMKLKDRRQALETIKLTVTKMLEQHDKVVVDVFSFSQYVYDLEHKTEISSKLDLLNLLKRVRKNYVNAAIDKYAWTDWQGAFAKIEKTSQNAFVFISNGLPNGTVDGRGTQINAMDFDLFKKEAIIVGLGEKGISQLFQHIDRESYLEFIDNLSSHCEDFYESETTLEVFPNPFSSNFSLKADKNIFDNAILRIVNQNGQMVYSQFLQNQGNELNISLPNLKPGAYTLYIRSLGSNELLVEQIIKI